MTTPDLVDEARQEFRTQVLDWFTVLDNPAVSVEVANGAASKMRDWIQSLDRRGIAVDVLLPFLSDNSPALRCGAATFLLDRGHVDAALSVLRALADNDDLGSIASSADTTLLGWEQEHPATD